MNSLLILCGPNEHSQCTPINIFYSEVVNTHCFDILGLLLTKIITEKFLPDTKDSDGIYTPE